MMIDVCGEVAKLREMTVQSLLARYQEVFAESARSRHREHLVRRIAWRMQVLAEGDLTDRARQRAAELARDADLRLRPPNPHAAGSVRKNAKPSTDFRLPKPGTVLVRTYKGRTIQVRVLKQGFECDDRIYRTLTAVVKKITGTHWNGYHFFGLTPAGNRKKRA